MAVRPPQSPAGKQLAWILTLASKLPLSTKEIQAHFDSAFLDQVSPAEINQALEQLGPPGSAVTLRGLSQVNRRRWSPWSRSARPAICFN